MTSPNLEQSLAKGISKGISDGIGNAIGETLVAAAAIGAIALAVFPSLTPTLKTASGHSFEPITVHIGPHFYDDSPSGSYDYVLERDGSTSVPIPSPCNGTIGGVYFQGVTGGLATGRGAGQIVGVACDGADYWLFGHLIEGSQTKKPGDRIAKGETLGTQGTTGRSSGDHIHNQIHRWTKGDDGVPVRGDRITDRSYTKPLIMAYIEFLRKGQKRSPSNLSTGFNQAYDWTLGKEGGCSDHPADRGGRTYKGIIRSVARRHGYDDPCTIPESKIQEIYLKEYWEPAKCDQWQSGEMQLTCFDTVVNFGLGGWQMFRDQGSRRDGHRHPSLPKDEKEAALAIAQWRLDFRDFRVKEAPDQVVFLRGWRNRDNDLLRKVGG
ncbi:glycosyl hydrolase 108 family protein [Oscillatoria acuminata]|uniref:Putative secretion activating protein n=1 Tax=Oscillatoria acuminata PCC 6304 TaxID=56110 RepID=K9TTY8_9CYAN|nr:glycosyl hydrolase 108 family protein [Oscillatoria acuminata]AFY85479.1 putative secretion activating protein [Oscillatoria acuminata PCC 6304]